jgi:hypothetical protein
MMKSVFIAGSRSVSTLSPQVVERLNNIIRLGLVVLIGDANGADKAVQQYLARHHYDKVIVYCMCECRNNVGDWPSKRHATPSGAKRDRHYYGVKDRAMAKDADWGFMVWNGASKGTLTNLVNLLELRKKSLLYLVPRDQFFRINAFGDLETALRTDGVSSEGLTEALGHSSPPGVSGVAQPDPVSIVQLPF